MPRAFQYGLNILRTWSQDLKELESVLPQIAHIPTLILWGGLDFAVDPNSAGPLSRQFAHCKCKVFDGVGHLPYEEVPEEFNSAVLDFLTPGSDRDCSEA